MTGCAGRPVSPKQMAALMVVVERAGGAAATYVTAAPRSGSEISAVTAGALADRGLIELTGAWAWPTLAGHRAVAVATRITAARQRRKDNRQ